MRKTKEIRKGREKTSKKKRRRGEAGEKWRDHAHERRAE